jgi:WD40 repeat protein
LKTILRGHEHEPWSVAFSPDGKLLATGGKDCKVMLWSGGVRPAPKTVPVALSARPNFTPDGKQLLASGDSSTRAPSVLWDVDELTATLELPGRRFMGFSPDSQHLVRWAAGGGALEWFSLTSNLSRTIPLGGLDELSRNVQRQGFSADWNYFFAVDGAGRAGIWNATTGELLGACQDLNLPISAGALSPDGRYLALGSQTETVVRLYDRAANITRQLAAHHDTIRGLAFSPDGNLLASGSLDGSIVLWHPLTGERRGELPGHMEETSDVTFSPDGRTLASVNVRHSIKLWHVATRRELHSWDFPPAGAFLQFSPDGRHLAVLTRTNSIQLFAAPP